MRSSIRGRGRWIAGLFVALPVIAQAPQPAASSVGAPGNPASAPAIREIDDPHSGARWLLVRDDAHPGGPGRLVLQPGSAMERPEAPQPGMPIALPVIHAGDRVQVEEHTPVVDAVLDAVALGPAVASGPLRVRLKLGGRVVGAVAAGPGRATLIPEVEARP